ncbi:DNA polymerase Y family protein [Corynebacterium sp.]|uniref:DNA polymerase Y family protein n=1 Tax=Corynebacterium sp. TaxID=1720 RepID=UPI0026DD5BBD|nr:DNA polymerase Y family protein [Corynebacterium sp.]MDO5031235.1 DNA polymerase Y family protein [Corynebacterium sp.]
MRVAALWFPDWPVQALREGLPVKGKTQEEQGACAVVRQHQVLACNAAARRAGIRRGMRVRQAQAVAPQLRVEEANPDRDGAVFAQIAVGLDAVASSVEVLRPGLVIVDAAAAGRFHGGEDTAAEMLVDAAAHAGLDATIGVADEIATALIAARHEGLGAVVPEGGSRQFLAAQPLGVLAAEVCLGCPPELVAQLRALGLRTLGELAELPLRQMSTRFGEAGKRCHAIASAAPDRRVAPELARPDLAVEENFEEPLERVDAAAFAARQLAARLHVRLRAAGQVCLRLRVCAEFERGERVERVWRTQEALSESATADRVRWQLDGWLSSARAGEGGGVVKLLLEPVETAAPEARGLWGAAASTEQAKRVISRVQSQLGVDRVLQPRDGGGRGVAGRIEYVPYGEQREPAPQGTWPGRIPAPLPAQLAHPAARIRIVDASAAELFVTAEALLSGEPAAVSWSRQRYRVIGWAGPWPVEAWGEQRCARLQVVGESERGQRAWLLVWAAGRWSVEATYT